MPIIRIPINLGPNRAIDEVGLVGFNSFLYDGFVDAAGNVNRRPGLVLFCDLSVAAGIDGIYWWDRQGKTIVVCNGVVYSLDINGTPTDLGGDTLEVGAPVYFSDFGTTLYAANGGRIVSIPAVGAPAYVSDGDAPTSVTAIADIDTYLLALEASTERVWYADAGDPTSWSGLFVSAQYNPDFAKMLGVKNDIIEIMGTSSLEGWRTTSSSDSPLIKEGQYTVDRGIISPHSMRYCTGIDGIGSWYWLDNYRQIVRMAGRQVLTVAPFSLTKYLQTFTTVSDAIGGECSINGMPHYILTFPTQNETIAINLGLNTWSEFGKWNTGTASHDRFLGQCFTFASTWNKQLVGSHGTGKIYYLDPTVYQDDGETLNTLIRTENTDQGSTGVKKHPKNVFLYVKKSNVVSIDAASTMTAKWRDNGETSWKTERTIALGRVGKSGNRGRIPPPGSYYSRQYQFSVTDNAPWVFVRADEEF